MAAGDSKTTEQASIMLSYETDCQKMASYVYQYLKKRVSWPVWMDKHDAAHASFSANMAEAVQNCSLIVCFLTPSYQNDPSCERELTYAANLGKSIIPCFVGATSVFDSDEESDDEQQYYNDSWRPGAWLGLLIADLPQIPFHDVNDNNIDQKCEDLTQRIEKYFKKETF